MPESYKTLHVDHAAGVALIVLHSPPLNQWSETLIRELTDAFRSAFDDGDVRAVILTGSKTSFITGPDIGDILKMERQEDLVPILRSGHQLLNMIESGPKPVIAAINGHCSRAGLEVALACHFRIASRKLRVGLLDVRYDLVPGLGGTQRLPRLIGIKPALELMTAGKDIAVEDAWALGLVDEVARYRDLLDEAKSAGQRFIQGRINYKMCLTSKRFDKLMSMKEKKEVAARYRQRLAKTAKGYLAPFKIVDAVEQGLGLNFEADLVHEMNLYCDCALSPVARNLVTLFISTHKAGNPGYLNSEQPRKIRKIGVLGSGTMGTGITAFLLSRGVDVWLWDMDQKRIRSGINGIRSIFGRYLKQGKLTRKHLDQWISQRLKLTTSIKDFTEVDLVIEAVIEDLDAKQRLFKRLESVCGPRTIFATASAALCVADIADGLADPDRMIGLRFFNPPGKIQLMEVISTEIADDAVVATGVDFARKIGKIPMVVNDGPGFFLSRQLLLFMTEAMEMVSEGADPMRIDQAAIDFGFPMGPFQLADLSGMDQVLAATMALKKRLGKRWAPPSLLNHLNLAGWLGRKAKAGWYDFHDDTPAPNPLLMKKLKQLRAEKKIESDPGTDAEIVDQLLMRLINEAAFMREEGFSCAPEIMDMAAVYGMGFPPYLGGLWRYADAMGAEKLLVHLRELAEKKGARFIPSALIRKTAESGRAFYDVLKPEKP